VATWRHFGFAFTPFSTKTIEATQDGPNSMKLFVGREEQLRRVTERIESNHDGSRQVVEGPLGAGKTSLLTIAKIRLGQETNDRGPFFIPISHVRFRTDTSFEAFAYSVMDNILATVRAPQFPHKPAAGSALAQAIQLLAGGRDRQGGGNLGPVGVQGGKTTVAPFVEPRIDWLRLLQEVALEIQALGYEGIVIHVNNLETMVDRAADVLETVLHDSRDLFQTAGCHFVFVAPPGFTTNVVGRIEAVRTIVPNIPVAVEPFTAKQFANAVSIRYEHAKDATKYVPPVAAPVAQRLYEMTGGSLRATFQTIDSWVELLDPVKARTAASLDELASVLKPHYMAELAKLPQRERDTLDAAMRLGDPFRQKGVTAHLKAEQSNVSLWMTKLEEKGFILFERQDGTSKWYRLDERAIFAQWGTPRGPGGTAAEPAEPASKKPRKEAT